LETLKESFKKPLYFILYTKAHQLNGTGFPGKEKQVLKSHITDAKSALKCCILLHFSSLYVSFFPFSPDLQVSLVTAISKNKTHM